MAVIANRLYKIRLQKRSRHRLLTPLTGHDCLYLAFWRLRVHIGLKVRS